EHGIDGRQGVEGDPGRVDALGPHEPKGACAFGPHRINEQIFAHRLDEESGVADVGDAQAFAVVTRGRAIHWERAGKALRPRLATLAQLPFEKGSWPLWPHAAWIEEAHAVEVIGHGAAVVGIGAPAG